MTKKRRIVLFTPLIVILLLGAWGAYLLFSPFTDQKDRVILIHEGDSFETVVSQLDTLTTKPRLAVFKAMAALSGYKNHPRAGRYGVSEVGTFRLLQNLRHRIQKPIRYNIPIVWTKEQLAQRLSQKFLADSAAFAEVFSDTVFLAERGVTPDELFTLIIPDTYEFYWTLEPRQFVQRMYKASLQFWNAERLSQAEAQGLSPKEVVVLASIVERETAKDDEKPIIAGLYLNRLHRGMKLQADPTVKYAVGDLALRRILNRHLQTPSPYNTYLHEGLPPAPISLPSRASIEAVLHATSHNYIYMCAREDFSGYHNYSSSYAEHQENARKYVKALNERAKK